MPSLQAAGRTCQGNGCLFPLSPSGSAASRCRIRATAWMVSQSKPRRARKPASRRAAASGSAPNCVPKRRRARSRTASSPGSLFVVARRPHAAPPGAPSARARDQPRASGVRKRPGARPSRSCSFAAEYRAAKRRVVEVAELPQPRRPLPPTTSAVEAGALADATSTREPSGRAAQAASAPAPAPDRARPQRGAARPPQGSARLPARKIAGKRHLRRHVEGPRAIQVDDDTLDSRRACRPATSPRRRPASGAGRRASPATHMAARPAPQPDADDRMPRSTRLPPWRCLGRGSGSTPD